MIYKLDMIPCKWSKKKERKKETSYYIVQTFLLEKCNNPSSLTSAAKIISEAPFSVIGTTFQRRAKP